MSTEQIDVLNPTMDVVKAVRKQAGLTGEQAANLAGLSSYVRWFEYENGTRKPSSERWELFLLRVGMHPTLMLHVRREAVTVITGNAK